MEQNNNVLPFNKNRAFIEGDAVKVFFFVRNAEIILAEDCYFFLMASMRKMRMNIPLSFTLEFFQSLITENCIEKQSLKNGIVQLLVYRGNHQDYLAKADVHYILNSLPKEDVFAIQGELELDIIKEIHVNTHLLSNIRVHCPENIYAQIYAQENDLDDLILLNPSKRIARSIYGNLLFLDGNTIKVPKQTEGAYISPLMESFVTFIHKSSLASIEEHELLAFESQKSEEIVMISDEKGIFSVTKIRNRSFPSVRFPEMVRLWRESL